MEKIKNDIKKDAYYLINKFNQKGKDVSNMQIQKLMFFFEAYYMNVKDTDKLYDCNFCAWAYGPVAIPLYKEFKSFGSGNIELTKEKIEEGEKIPGEHKKLLDVIYDAFKDQKAIDLVRLTHMKNSPWTEVWNRNGNKVGYGEETYIDKLETKKWFKENFIKNEKE